MWRKLATTALSCIPQLSSALNEPAGKAPAPFACRESQLGTTAILVSVMFFLLETGLQHSSHHLSDCVNMVTVSSH